MAQDLLQNWLEDCPIQYAASEADYLRLNDGKNTFLHPVVVYDNYIVHPLIFAVKPDDDLFRLLPRGLGAVIRLREYNEHLPFPEREKLRNIVMRAIHVNPELMQALNLTSALEKLTPDRFVPRTVASGIGWSKRPVVEAMQDVASFNTLARYAMFMTNYRGEDIVRLSAELMCADPGPIRPGPLWPDAKTPEMLSNWFALAKAAAKADTVEDGEEEEEIVFKPFIWGQVSLQALFIEGFEANEKVVAICASTPAFFPARRHVVSRPGEGGAIDDMVLSILQHPKTPSEYDGAMVSRVQEFVAAKSKRRSLQVLDEAMATIYDRVATQTFLALLGYTQTKKEAVWKIDVERAIRASSPDAKEALNAAVLDACDLVDQLTHGPTYTLSY